MARTSKRQKLTQRALDYLRACVSTNRELVDEYESNIDAYLSKPYGNEVEGRSQIVASDVSDTVEAIMPSLMKVFYGGTEVVTLKPQGPEDEEKAKLMEQKVNFDFQRGMNGYTVLHDWFKDALLGKFSAVKYWWEEKECYDFKKYSDLNEMEYQALVADPKFKITDEEMEEEEVPVGVDMFGNPVMQMIAKYDVEGYRTYEESRPMAEVIPPHELIFDLRTRGSLADAEFVAHKKRVHKNHLKKYGVSQKDIEQTRQSFTNADDYYDQDNLYYDLGGMRFISDPDNEDFVYIYECYLNEYDSDGVPKPKIVTIFGDNAISVKDNNYGKPTFCGLTCVRMPHRATGRSLVELVTEIQKIKTSLTRAILDNIYYQNNGITVVNPYRINMDDVTDRNEPGAVWRTLFDIDPNTAMAPVPTSPLAQHTIQMYEVIESMKEKRTGVTAYNQGLDSKSLNKTATGISQIMSAAQQRMELIARMFAETGVRELFEAFVDMNLKFLDRETSVKVNDQWAKISPDMIDGKFDIIIDVGVGTGSAEIQINQLINMLNVSQPAVQMGVVSRENIYEILRSIYELMGYKNPDKFVSNPKDPATQQPSEKEMQLMQELNQMKQIVQALDTELKIANAGIMVDREKNQIEREKVYLDHGKDIRNLEIKEDKLILDHEKEVNNVRVKEIAARTRIAEKRGRGVATTSINQGLQGERRNSPV